jgi:iron complex transport system substrate-binding protein
VNPTWRRIASTALMTIAATLIPGAGALAQLTLRDDRGVSVSLPAPPQRIVSLLPSLTESVCALGACGRLVGTDQFSNWPASVARLPKLGGLDDAQIERIVALRPDVVLVSSSARVVDRLEALGMKVVALESRDHADAKRSLTLIAELLGTPAEAERVWAGIERETRAAVERVPAVLRGQRVYFEIDSTPYGAGVHSFIGETLTRLGLANALPAELGPFPKLNPEYIVRLQPDIVMAGRASLAEMPRRPGWSALRALRDAHSCGFASDRYDLLVRAGPRMGEAAGVIADCLVAIGARSAAKPLTR